MNWNIILTGYILFFAIFGTFVFVLLIRDLISGKYKGIRKLEEEFSELEEEVKARRRKILGDNDD